MKPLKTVYLFFVICLTSCQESLYDYATAWTNDIKAKINVDASQLPDKTTFDSTTGEFASYKGNTKLRYFKLGIDDSGKLVSSDTVVSILYSTDQQFELVREHCPAVTRSYEGVRYKGNSVGVVELKYCNGKIKERGFRFYGDVGEWEEYDSVGNVIRTVDHQEVVRLKMLKDIKYSR